MPKVTHEYTTIWVTVPPATLEEMLNHYAKDRWLLTAMNDKVAVLVRTHITGDTHEHFLPKDQRH
jgi:hypothetical protein